MTLSTRGLSQETITEDVSYRGIFVVTDEPPVLRSLIQVRATLPETGTLMETHAMSVFRIERGNSGGRTPGCGLQFYAMSEPAKSRWNGFIDAVRRKVSPATPQTKPRRFVRFALRLAVKPKNLDELFTLYTRDISRGGMFLLSPEPLDVGAELAVDVFHPDTEEVFNLECVVRRTEPGPPIGIGVEFHKLDEIRRAAFFDFVHSAVEELTADDLMWVSEDDPQLA